MKIQLKINEKPIVKLPVMLCDEPLDKKLDKYELTKFLNCHSTNLLIGKPRSGKTSTLWSFLGNKKLLNSIWENIFLFQPISSGKSIQNNIFDKLDPECKFNELTMENLQSVVDMVKLDSQDGYNSCIVLDDMQSYLKDDGIKKLLKELVANRRHYKTSIYFLCQSYRTIEKDVRKMFSNLFIFRVSISELEVIFEELIESHKKIVTDIAKLVYDKPHQYLFINVDTQKLFKGFDELIITV